MNLTLKTLSLPLVAVLALAACDDPPPPKTANDIAPPPPAPAAPAPVESSDGDGASGVGVDERIAKMCDLPNAYFNFDSAAVSTDARAVLDKIVSCFKDGAGKDKNLNVVGHADPRGETEDNFALGQRRAGSVAGYLTKAGLPESRIETSSRGELEASGSDTETWAKDRKVEILLAD